MVARRKAYGACVFIVDAGNVLLPRIEAIAGFNGEDVNVGWGLERGWKLSSQNTILNAATLAPR